MLRVRDARRRVVSELRRFAASKRADDPREQDGDRVAAGVDDAGLAQHREQVGTALDRLLAGVERALDHVRDHLVLLERRRVGAEPAVGRVRELGGDAMGHLTDDGQDRSLGGLADRAVGLVGGAGQGGADQNRVDQLTGAARQFLGGAADQLREDHSGVAAGAEQRRTGDRGDDLVAPDLIDRAALGGPGKPIELLQHSAQGQHHVVSRIAIGNWEHVEVVDLLATVLERRQTGLDDRPEANDAGIGHAGPTDRSLGCGHYLALTILPAFRQRVQTYTRRGVPLSSIRTRWRLGSKRRLVATIEWLRLWPKDGPLAQT